MGTRMADPSSLSMADADSVSSDSESDVSLTTIGEDFLPLMTLGASSSSLLSPGVASCLGLLFGRRADGGTAGGGGTGAGGIYAGLPS
jgi:hypothetical protein